VPLDEKDEILLSALERDARASVVDLARRIGLSRSATQDRLAKLERTGAIAGYTIRRGVGESNARLSAWLMLRHDKGGSCGPPSAILRRIPEIVSIQALAGDPDMLVRVEAAGSADLSRIVAAVKAISGIASVSTHVVLSGQ
jgi:Lrp/AsnC family leucine-responsive transcriptional regulator